MLTIISGPLMRDPCLEDLGGSHQVDASDLGQLLGIRDAEGPDDLDGDGRTDSELGLLWGACASAPPDRPQPTLHPKSMPPHLPGFWFSRFLLESRRERLRR